jgi:hypothetical protein
VPTREPVRGTAVTTWRGETQSSPSALLRRGWTADSIRVGQTIVARGYPQRTPSVPPALVIVEVILPDGRTLDASSAGFWQRLR